MKTLNQGIAGLAAFFGIAALVLGGLAQHDATSALAGVILLLCAVMFATFGSALGLLEGIREDLRTAARGLQKDLRAPAGPANSGKAAT